MHDIDLSAWLPVEILDTGSKHKYPEQGIALCLSGGGYRAMLFHLGALWRLNELGYLKKLCRISSVSGGAIAAAVLAYHWDKLSFDAHDVGMRFIEEVVEPIRKLSMSTIDIGAVWKGAFYPGLAAARIRDAFRKILFGRATLQDIPDSPRFVFNASNVGSGALWRFMKPRMIDYRVGMVEEPTIELAEAVAASSACPPLLSPFRLKLKQSDYTPYSDMQYHMQYSRKPDLDYAPFTTDILLSDGGIYDNLGLETAWKRYETVLVSDAGSKMTPQQKPKPFLISHSIRIVQIIDNQVRALRKRQLIESFKLRKHLLEQGQDTESDFFRLVTRKGAYWGVYSDILHYDLDDALDCPLEKTNKLAAIKTRFKRLDATTQERLINWGYAICDAAMRKHVDAILPAPDGFPYAGGVG
jgi:NTE family protein